MYTLASVTYWKTLKPTGTDQKREKCIQNYIAQEVQCQSIAALHFV